jgi:2,3-dihydroxybenzoate decarboxylase
MYSVDFPFEDVIEAKEWFDQAAISDSDRAKIARGNAQKLFRGRVGPGTFTLSLSQNRT